MRFRRTNPELIYELCEAYGKLVERLERKLDENNIITFHASYIEIEMEEIERFIIHLRELYPNGEDDCFSADFDLNKFQLHKL